MKRHPPARRFATLLATVQHLETKTIDDALDLLDLLMVTELRGKAHREADKQKIGKHPKLAKASARLALAMEVMLEASEWGEDVGLFEVWEMIDAVVPRCELRAAVATVTAMVPPPDVDDDGGWRAELAGRIATVSGFVKILTKVIEFGAHGEGQTVLAAMQGLPNVLAYKSRKHSATQVPAKMIDAGLVIGPWKRLCSATRPAPMGSPPATPTCCVCWNSSTGTSSAGRSTRSVLADGVTRTPSCWRGPRGRRCGTRC